MHWGVCGSLGACLPAHFIKVSSSRSPFSEFPLLARPADLPQYREILGFASLFPLFCQARVLFVVVVALLLFKTAFLCEALVVLSCPELAL